VEELQSAWNAGGVEACRRLLERKRDEWKDIPLNVAVIGGSGVGKSSFINAIRRLSAEDEGAAAVGLTATTFDIRSYSHPNNPLLKFWDLPGVGTNRFPMQTYLSAIDVDRFDFFLLITADRFRERDLWLCDEFRKRNKKGFFVRAKIGMDISDSKIAHPKTHNEEVVTREIRESTRKQLTAIGCEDVPVFLIESYKPQKFDFDVLEHHIIEEFLKRKKNALIQSFQATSIEMIRLAEAELRSRMWDRAAMASEAAAIPVPGRRYWSFDLTLVTEEAKIYHRQLGLDATSLKRYAKVMSTDYQQLKSHVDRCLGCEVMDVEGAKKLVEQLLSEHLDEYGALRLIALFMKGHGGHVRGTRYVLKLLLNKMESVAQEVIRFAFDNIDFYDYD